MDTIILNKVEFRRNSRIRQNYQIFIFFTHLFRKIKICEHDMAGIMEKNIFGLQISVDETTRMEIFCDRRDRSLVSRYLRLVDKSKQNRSKICE
jgi:hypothetical protein